MKKKTVSSAATSKDGPSHLAAIESDVLCKCPELVKHCAITRYDDGDPRKTGWFTVKTMGSAWVVQVKDPDACLSLTATGQSLDDALCLADLLLGSQEAPWEPDPFLKRNMANGKPKKGD